MIIELEDDAFSDAQIRSKLMAVEKLEEIMYGVYKSVNIDLYAGWYGMTAFLLMTRGRVEAGRIRSYDCDPAATAVANRLNRRYSISQSVFTAYTFDVNHLRPIPGEVDIIVNTAVEHMDRNDWFQNIPSGTVVLLQGSDLVHAGMDDPNRISSIDQMKNQYPLRPLYQGSDSTMEFSYPTGSFRRYQIVGTKL